MDREWFQVEGLDGRPAPGSVERREYPNRESAIAAASGAAEDTSESLLVVKYTRREIRRVKRVITIEEKDVSSPTATPVP